MLAKISNPKSQQTSSSPIAGEQPGLCLGLRGTVFSARYPSGSGGGREVDNALCNVIREGPWKLPQPRTKMSFNQGGLSMRSILLLGNNRQFNAIGRCWQVARQLVAAVMIKPPGLGPAVLGGVLALD